MSAVTAAAWDARVARLLTRLPDRGRATVAWLRHPPRRWPRLLAAVALMAGGIFSILPVLGLWMLPLGLALMSDDVPWLKTPLEFSARWIERSWRRLRAAWQRRRRRRP
ncbi:hypothetical protein E2C06_11500 [Dankookia rubra]|uniref:Tryptophan synthase subunit beta n=1 Tax=Dankookia rubra TaxID=1442381 RepID=A0A4R5QI67_9PROT|nr:hypothetical protein [Dankookia rubra]TDH62488.1 hypothetical protein E2C06_11500 [Dankookia rubra]